MSPIEELKDKLHREFPSLKTGDIRPAVNEGEFFSIFLKMAGLCTSVGSPVVFFKSTGRTITAGMKSQIWN
jgi:hypothetical protein